MCATEAYVHHKRIPQPGEGRTCFRLTSLFMLAANARLRRQQMAAEALAAADAENGAPAPAEDNSAASAMLCHLPMQHHIACSLQYPGTHTLRLHQQGRKVRMVCRHG
jgi:hypothetical protein